jgi:hypothetical protein
VRSGLALAGSLYLVRRDLRHPVEAPILDVQIPRQLVGATRPPITPAARVASDNKRISRQVFGS